MVKRMCSLIYEGIMGVLGTATDAVEYKHKVRQNDLEVYIGLESCCI